MRKKTQVRFRTSSAVADRLGIPKDATGAVMCRYRVMREGEGAPARLDVRFGRRVAWGVVEREFEIVPFSSRPDEAREAQEASG